MDAHTRTEEYFKHARMWEISENLHRAELTVLERSEHVAEWVRLAENKGASCADIPRGRGQPQGGINAATRALGIDRSEAQRAVKIDALSDEAEEKGAVLAPLASVDGCPVRPPLHPARA